LWLASYSDGARARDPQTFLHDVQTLERVLRDEPNNARYVFYLAQTYLLIRDFDSALSHYRRRVEMGGRNDEVWISLYQIAQINIAIFHRNLLRIRDHAPGTWSESPHGRLGVPIAFAISPIDRNVNA